MMLFAINNNTQYVRIREKVLHIEFMKLAFDGASLSDQHFCIKMCQHVSLLLSAEWRPTTFRVICSAHPL